MEKNLKPGDHFLAILQKPVTWEARHLVEIKTRIELPKITFCKMENKLSNKKAVNCCEKTSVGGLFRAFTVACM